jgi:hypothetical protein
MRTRLLRAACAAALSAGLATAVAAAPTTYTSRTSFNTAAPGTLLEDFEEARFTSSLTPSVGTSLNSTTSNAVFSAGEIIPGVTFSTSNGTSLAAISPSVPGAPPTASLGATSGALHVLTFSTPVDAFALDVYTGGTPQVQLFDAANNSLGTFSLTLISGGVTPRYFFGVTTAAAEAPIARATVGAAGTTAQIDDVALRAVVAVPEPGALALAAPALLAMVGLSAVRARRRRA